MRSGDFTPRSGGGPTVLYIAGSGRSGSTVLERAIGAIDGYVNVGELLDLPRKVAPNDERCGCGRPFHDCPFWQAVGDLLPHGWDAGELRRLHHLQQRVARQRFLPRLLTGATGGRFRHQLAEYVEGLASIYQAVSDVSGQRVVVDASKWPALALALYSGGMDVRVIHLVRDPRGVAHSLSRHVDRPHGRAHAEEHMFRKPPVVGAASWLTTQAEIDLLAWRGLPVRQVSYEEFVREPGNVLARVLSGLSLPLPPGGLQHVHDNTIRLPASHGLSGNPSRFTVGAVELRQDERWRRDMAMHDRVLVGLVVSPRRLFTRTGGLPRSTPVPLPAIEGDPSPPAVSVVLTVPGGVPSSDSVRSVLDQEYPGKIELVLVGGRSHHPVDDVQGDRTRMVVHVPLEGPVSLAEARNAGLKAATGSLIAGLEDGHVWSPHKTQLQVAELRLRPDVLAVGGRLSTADTSVASGRSRARPARTVRRRPERHLAYSARILRRDALAKAGRYDETTSDPSEVDDRFVARLTRVGKVSAIDDIVAVRVSPTVTATFSGNHGNGGREISCGSPPPAALSDSPTRGSERAGG
ncbi:glycosyltransferase [Nostocoides sp. Soil756]|jgi:hypothetical protein|uniref:glycosyltransferase n=1 Tax=Nostocoides sp. Soil756 TaxID=1736399 RepID=UPI0006FF8580|nr:glycosyltransferase [Tetrasphaera sp. Soil756]KRE62032.1 hypothetical protein ASG78_02890 [Tetrasphaera sp. Soil756]